MKRCAACSLGLSLMLLALAVPGEATGQIAFQTFRHAQWEIYVMSSDGSNQTNLSNHSSHDIHPSWSPDGAQIAFSSSRQGVYQIFVMDADGNNQAQLTYGPGDHITPSWSPDGTQIAYTSSERQTWDVYVMEADGSDPVNLTASAWQDVWPTWSPDGTRLVFRSTRDRQGSFALILGYWGILAPDVSDLFVMDSSGGMATNLTAAFTWEVNADPAWSPDGGQILYVTGRAASGLRGSIAQVWALDVDSGERRPVEEELGNLLAPSWSPDGSQVVYAAAERLGVKRTPPETGGPDYDIYVIPASGGGRDVAVNLTLTPGWDTHPTWSPQSASSAVETSVKSTSWGTVKAERAQPRDAGEEAQ